MRGVDPEPAKVGGGWAMGDSLIVSSERADRGSRVTRISLHSFFTTRRNLPFSVRCYSIQEPTLSSHPYMAKILTMAGSGM